MLDIKRIRENLDEIKKAKKKLEKKYSKEQIADMLEEDVATIEAIINELQ